MTEKTIQACGAIVFWSLSGTNDSTLLEACFAANGFVDFTPPPQTRGEALKSALQEIYPTRTENDQCFLIRPTGRKDGSLVVVQERREDEQNEYAPVARYWTSKNHDGIDCDYGNGDVVQNPTDVYEAYMRNKRYVSNDRLTRALVGISYALNGVSLRANGGIYWIPEESLPRLQKLAEGIASAAVSTTSNIYFIKTMFDERAAEAVRDAIMRDVRLETETLEHNVLNKEYRQRALVCRKREAEALHDRIRYYESLLGVAMDSLHANLAKVEMSVAELTLAQINESFGDLVVKMGNENAHSDMGDSDDSPQPQKRFVLNIEKK